ncbi:MAG: hypothetical protein QXQ60_06185 [Thermofilum sp.]
MSHAALRSKSLKLTCTKCHEDSVVSISSEGMHAFVCPFCGQPHLILVDANLGIRDFRPVSSLPVRKPFEIAKVKVKDESLIPVTLKPFWEMVKRGVLPPNFEEGFAALEALGLLEVED